MIDALTTYWRLILVGVLLSTAAFGLGYLAANNSQRTPIIIQQGNQ